MCVHKKKRLEKEHTKTLCLRADGGDCNERLRFISSQTKEKQNGVSCLEVSKNKKKTQQQ